MFHSPRNSVIPSVNRKSSVHWNDLAFHLKDGRETDRGKLDPIPPQSERGKDSLTQRHNLPGTMDEQAKKTQKEKAKKEPSKRGRKALDKQTKRHYTIGSFKFTESEKRAYDALYGASGMSNQTEFFRKIIFEGGLKLYFSDKNTELIYEEITSIQREISKIGYLFNQVTARVNTNASDKNLFSSLNELKILLKKNEQFIREVQVLVEKLIEHSDDVRDETGIKFSELLVSELPKSQT